MPSILSVSNSSRVVNLKVQYRIPRPLAHILNQHVYHGGYKTAPRCGVTPVPFIFKQISEARDYANINEQEVEAAGEILRMLSNRGMDASQILILTPYKKQQKALQAMARRLEFCDTTKLRILSIDQAQGNEADVVILSFVRKPTRFLTTNRLCVAISRQKSKLFLLGDLNVLRTVGKKWPEEKMIHRLVELADSSMATG